MHVKYGIAIFPSKEIQDEANALRMRYDPEYAKIPPHITLKAAFEMDEVLRDELIIELKKIANSIKPFDIEIVKVSTFAPVTYTVYFKVEPHPSLTQLHELMHQGKFPSYRKYNFVPHITVAQELSEGEHHDVYERLRMKEIYFKDTVDRFHLCYQLENGSWSVYETFVFGKEQL